jgi:hypothetical protein
VSNPTAGHIFVDINGLPQSVGASEDSWRILSWSSVQDSFVQRNTQNQDHRIEPGKSYVFRHIKQTFDPLNSPAGRTLRTDKVDTIPLVQGWNLFSNPFLFPVSINRSDIDNATTPISVSPTGPRQKFPKTELFSLDRDTATLQPWRGYAVYCTAPTGSVALRPHNSGASSGSHLLSDVWMFTLSLLQDGQASSQIVGGYCDNASDDVDSYDSPDFDLFGRREGLRFSSKLGVGLTGDYRCLSALQIWELEITPETQNRLELCWEVPAPPRDNMVIVLRDAVTGQDIDMTGQKYYVIPSTHQLPPGRLRILVGSKEAIESNREDVATLPTGFRLYQNYPNPFNPTTSISYEIPHAADVALEIYNVLGARIRTLATGRLPQGSYVTLWDGKDDLGRSVASGVYFARLLAEDYKVTIKLMVLR